MKKVVCVLMIVSLLLSFSGCGNDKVDYKNYAGFWTTDDESGISLEVEVTDEKMKISLKSESGAPSYRVAEAIQSFKLSYIENSVVETDYTDDGWGNSGTIKLTFKKDSIVCEIKDVSSETASLWGINEGKYTLVKKEKPATEEEDYDYPEEEFWDDEDLESQATEPSGEYLATPEPEPVYDLSKASGILASLGMTEQEFRDSCMPLNPSVYKNIFILTKTTVPYVELEDLERNPGPYIGKHFVFSHNPYKDSSGQKNLDKLVPYAIGARDRYMSSGQSIIPYDNCLIYDMRDDIFSPNITKHARVVAYMIFTGLSPSGKAMEFQMISCDISYED